MRVINIKRLSLIMVLLWSMMSVLAEVKSTSASGIDVMQDSITKIYHNITGTRDTELGYGSYSSFQQGIFNLEELPTDEVKWLWDPTFFGQMNYGYVSEDLPAILGPWVRLTHIIELCNSFINQDFNLELIADEAERSKALKQRDDYIRQARIIRSAMYFYLVNEFGNVPYSDESMDTDAIPAQLSTDMAMGRKMVTEKVIKTLEEIVEWYKANDAHNKPVYGHVGLDVAEALLVKFYLNHEVLAGEPAWDKTLAHAKALISRRGNGGFMDSGLAMNYSQNFSYNNREAAENEIIWRIATIDPDGTELGSSSNGNFMTTAYLGYSSGGDSQIYWNPHDYNICSSDSWKCVVGLRQLSDVFEWNHETKEGLDQRTAWWGTSRHGFDVNNSSLRGEDWGKNGFIPVKFTNWNIKDDGSVDTSDIPEQSAPYCIDYAMIRLAEIYLSAAEAILNGAGDVAEALRYTNYVRQRAGMPPFASLDMETLQAERQRELYTECNRRTDLIRYGKWISGYDWNWKGGARKGRDYDANFIVYPIPSSIVEKYGYVQNPLAEPIEIEPVDVEPADWKLIGSFCDFDPGKAVSLQPQGDGSYMLTLSELEGSFGFITGDVWDDSRLGNGNLRGSLNGNIDIDLNGMGNYIETEGKLTNVKLLLYPYARVLRVMGLDKDHDSNISFGNPATVYLRGDVNDWDAPDEYKMTYEGEGRYSLKVKQLQGSFKFADRDWSVVNIGAKQTNLIVGNCTVVYNEDGANANTEMFNAPVALSDVEIILDMKHRTLTFCGLPEDQTIPEYDPNVTQYGHFILDADQLNKLGMVYTEDYDLMNLGIVLRNVDAGMQFYISSAIITPGMPTSWMHRAIMKYLYSADDSERRLSDGEIVSLHYPAESMNSGLFEVENDGDYRLTFNLDAKTMTVEETEQGIYICGNVWSENGVYNGFLTPSLNNKEVYDREFYLPKLGDVYQGRFRLASQNDGIYDLAQFRFFTNLAGWINDYCLGSNESDFYCLSVELVDTATFPIVERGLGNWGINSPGEWVIFSVDLKNMTVTFQTEEAFTGVNEINAENAESRPQWYNMQGIKVEHPAKGIYIKVTGDKREKVVVR